MSRLEGLVLAWVHVTEITRDVHVFVIANQQMKITACLLRLLLEFLQVLDNLEGIGAAIGDVPHLNNMGFARCPFTALVDDPRFLQHGNVVLIIAVNIADGDDAADPLPVILNGLRETQPRADPECGQQQCPSECCGY